MVSARFAHRVIQLRYIKELKFPPRVEESVAASLQMRRLCLFFGDDDSFTILSLFTHFRREH